MSKPQRTAPAPKPKSGFIGYEVEVEGTYWGVGVGGATVAKPYSVKMLVPANYNDGGRGNTYVKKALLGKIDGTPYLRSHKDAKGEQPFADYRQLRTHNIVDWSEVNDTKRADEVIREKTPDQMNADELKRALTKLGITYPNPARKSELVKLLAEAMATNVKAMDEDDDRPNFGVTPKGADKLDQNIDEVDVGTMVDTSEKDPNNPNLPKETDRFIDTFTS